MLRGASHIARELHHRASLLAGLQLARIPDEEGDHDEQHQRRVEDVRRPLVDDKVCLLAHDELHHAIDVPHQHGRRRRVQHIQARLPGHVGPLAGVRAQVGAVAEVEDQAAEDEAGGHQHLQAQAGDHDPASDGGVLGLDLQAAAGGLDVEAEEVAGNEDDGGPARGHEREAGAVHSAHEPRVDHVLRRGEQDGRQEQEEGLQDVRGQGARGVVGCCAGDVADLFDCGEEVVLVAGLAGFERSVGQGEGRKGTYRGRR